jgi:hypothetical protein
MGSKPARCRIGAHTWVRCRPPDGRPVHGVVHGIDHWACTGCGKRRDAGTIPLGLLGG